jgi:hypothetical protein
MCSRQSVAINIDQATQIAREFFNRIGRVVMLDSCMRRKVTKPGRRSGDDRPIKDAHLPAAAEDRATLDDPFATVIDHDSARGSGH